MSAYDAIVIIYNPNSTGPSQDMASKLREELKPYYPKLKIKLVATEHAGHAEEIAYTTAQKYKSPLIISSSGDGGYNEVVNGAMRAAAKGAKPICAVLPAGNANDHRRSTKRTPLAEAIKRENIEKLDLISMEVKAGRKTSQRYAHSYVGLGFTPVVAAELNKQSLNALREMIIIVKTFYKFRPFTIAVKNKTKKLDSIIFTNIGEMAKLLTLSKESNLKDGKFEVITFPHARKRQLLWRLFKAASGALHEAKSCRRFSFQVLKSMPVQLDGEVDRLQAGSELTIKSVRAALRSIR